MLTISYLNQRERIKINHCGRNGHKRRVETVEHSAVSGKYVPAVLYAKRAFKQTFNEVAPSAEDCHNYAKSDPLRNTATAMTKMPPPMLPSQLFAGLMRGKSLCLPKSEPEQ